MAFARPQLKRHVQDFEPLGGLPRSQYGPKEGWLTFVIVLLLVLSVVWSVETAHWVSGMPSFSMTAIVAVIAGMVLAKVKRRAILLHGISAVLAYVMLVWQSRYLTQDGWFIAKTSDMVSRSAGVGGCGGVGGDKRGPAALRNHSLHIYVDSHLPGVVVRVQVAAVLARGDTGQGWRCS